MPPREIHRRWFAALVASLSLAIAAILLWPPGAASPVRSSGDASPSARPSEAYVEPANYLAWVPGGFDDPSFRKEMEHLSALREVVVVAGDTLWLRRTEDENGAVVDEPPSPFAFPIDAFAVDANDYAPFVAPSEREELVAALRAGEAVLGERSARLRGLGPGGALIFRTGSVSVGAVVPDPAVGWSEVMVSREVGRSLGIEHERYLLAQPRLELTRRAWKRFLLPHVGDNALRVDVPGDTPFMRVASGVNPPIVVKEVFGEFAATQQADPAFLTIEPSWVDRNIVTTTVPLLGTVTCHRRLIPMVRGALQEISEAGLASEIKVYSGCWAARTVARSSTAPPSTHAYGAAIDINAPYSPYGAPPNMDPDVVRIFESWGFDWGGDFLIPDGHHFEFRRIPDQLRGS